SVVMVTFSNEVSPASRSSLNNKGKSGRMEECLRLTWKPSCNLLIASSSVIDSRSADPPNNFIFVKVASDAPGKCPSTGFPSRLDSCIQYSNLSSPFNSLGQEVSSPPWITDG